MKSRLQPGVMRNLIWIFQRPAAVVIYFLLLKSRHLSYLSVDLPCG